MDNLANAKHHQNGNLQRSRIANKRDAVQVLAQSNILSVWDGPCQKYNVAQQNGITRLPG